ncbi:MAG TPA: amino acid adenylation domain-containing protein, partial [Anaerolineae bacterium]|nr:amino acid adenylation domain-containing protein [Anaerolineae bacterium]
MTLENFIAETEYLTDDSDDVYVFPVSFAQQRLWFLDQFEPNSPYYNIPVAVRLHGRLQPAILENVLNEIVQRHEILRTTFGAVDGEPVQIISPDGRLPLPLHDLRHLPPEEREREALRLANEEAKRPFNLTTGPLFRANLYQLADDEFVAIFVMHHIISDGWSISVLMREISLLYDAFAAGRPSPLPELPIQYADFAEWQREWLQGDVLESQLAYWREKLGDQPPVLELPTNRPRPAVQTSRGATVSHTLPPDLMTAVNQLCRETGVTQFMLLLAAFQVLLYRYSGQTTVNVGSPIANRTRGEIEGLIGFFINTLVLRADLAGEMRFRDLLAQVKETTLEAYAHQDLPFESLVEAIQPERDMSHSPLFQVMFILQNAPTRAQELPDLRLEMIDVDTGTATFDITLSLGEWGDGGMDASMEFNTDLFDRGTIERMLTHYETLLRGIVAGPDTAVSRLPLLTENEQWQILVEWNDTTRPYPLDQCVHQLFEKQVETTPQATAVVWQEETLTYDQLNWRANQLAHYLRQKGVGPESRVAVCVARSLDMVIAALGVLKAGGAYLPLDPDYPAERLAFMLADAQPTAVISQTAVSQSALAGIADNFNLIHLDGDQATIARQPETNPANQTAPDNLAYLIYTSGSTGKAKGVMIEHRNLANAYFAWHEAYDLENARVHLQMANFAFDVFSGDMARALLSGGKLVICPREWLLLPEKLYGLMQEHQVEIAEFVPVVLRHLAQYLTENNLDLSFMRLLICGSDNWYVGEYKQFLRLCGPQTRLINSFGLTEATIDSSYFESGRLNLPTEQVVPIGRPFPNMQLYILDPRQQPVPIGVPGELYVGGHGVARGYWQRPDLTEDKFSVFSFQYSVNSTLNTENCVLNTVYKTGDLARFLPDGNVEFLGRLDHQVKIRGFRIEPAEIEAALKEHTAVHQVAVKAWETPGGDRRLAAYIVAGPDNPPQPGQLRRFAQERLPDYMVPAAFVLLDEMPLLANGKVNRRALPEPDWSERSLDNAFVAPRTAVEEQLANIFREVLEAAQVGVHDNFFDLGGHSLLATQLVSRVREAFAIDLPLRAIFESPTVAALAEQVEIGQRGGASTQAPPLQPVPRTAEMPLSFAQQRLWFLDQLEPGSPFYNIPEALRLTGVLDTGVLERALNEIVRRHEILRTTFPMTDGRPYQHILPELTIPLPVADLRHLPEGEREAAAQRLANEEAQRPFNLVSGPLLRGKLIRLADDDWLILLTLHHIIGDDWSTSVLIQEVAVLYEAFGHGRFSPLPELPIQYADYAHWQRHWLQGEVLAEQLNYWKTQLADSPAQLNLPTDRPRPPVQTFAGDYISFSLPADLSQQIRELCRAEGITPFMFLLAAFQTLLSRYSSQKRVNVGSPIANRGRMELEGLVGLFVNTLVLASDFQENPTFRQLLQQTRETALGAFAHQDIPFEMIVDAVQPERNLSHSPLFQAMFVTQGRHMQQQEALELPDLTIQPVEAHLGIAKFDLTLFMLEEGSQFSGAWEYNTDLFDRGTIERMMSHFITLLRGVVTNPEEKTSRLPLLTEAERHQLLVEWNDTAVPVPDLCVHQLFEAQAEKTPQATAVRFADQTLTYEQLDQKANQLAHYLRQQGVQNEALVGVCLNRSPELVIALLAVLKAGGAYIPLDPAYPPERLAFMIQDAQPALVLTDSQIVESSLSRVVESSDSHVVLLCNNQIIALPNHHTIQLSGYKTTRLPDYQTNPDSLAYVIYTSGSTGKPKGAMLLHRGVVNYLTWCQQAYPVTKGQGAPVHSSISFDLTVTSLFAPLVNGRCVHLLPEDVGVELLADALRQNDNYSLVKITPAHLELLSQQLDPAEAAGKTRSFIIGGENLLADHIAFWQKHAPETTLFNEYGPTETVVGCCVYRLPPGKQPEGAVPIGRPIINTQLYILDEEMQPVPIGVPGELYIGGVQVGRGYLNRPELTEDKFVQCSVSNSLNTENCTLNTVYRTGDLARWRPDGNIEFLGRLDDQVKIRGFRIELGEIEAALQTHPAVNKTAVIDHVEENGRKRLIAYLTPQGDAAPTVADLRRFLEQTLPEYMIPAAFVTLDEMPLTPNGKVDRKALPAPDAARPELAAAFAAPETEQEKILADIWA